MQDRILRLTNNVRITKENNVTINQLLWYNYLPESGLRFVYAVYI